MAVLQNAPNLSSLREQLTSRVSYSFCGSGIWEQPSWVTVVKLSAGAALIWRLAWGWMICFQDGSLTTQLANWCWMLVSGLSSLPYGPSTVYVTVLGYDLWVPRDCAIQESESQVALTLWPSFRNHIWSFLPHSHDWKQISEFIPHAVRGK